MVIRMAKAEFDAPYHLRGPFEDRHCTFFSILASKVDST